MNLKLISAILVIALTSCHREINRTTGWDYYETSPKTGGFKKVPFAKQETAPGMILIEGGTYRLPQLFHVDSISVESFYLSKYEETNGQYVEYLNFLKKHYSERTYENALPDTTVWNQLEASERVKDHLVTNYLRDWTYQDYPVVGVSPDQIEKYARWKTDRINEMILIREGVLSENRVIKDSTNVFSTHKYLIGSFSEPVALSDLNPNNVGQGKLGERQVRMEDGIFMPRFRLPTENEWKLAHLGMGDSNNRYLKTPKPYKVKLDDFLFLEDAERSAKKTYPPEIKLEGLRKVYRPGENVYHLKGLNSNVAEFVADSVSVGVIGGSFLATKLGYMAFYDKDVPTKYRIISFAQDAVEANKSDTGITGFRLAMDCYMEEWVKYQASRKRNRYKSKM